MRVDRDRFIDQGYLILRNVIPPNRLEAMRASCETILERQKVVWARERGPDDPPGGLYETDRQPRVLVEEPGLIDVETSNVVEDFWVADLPAAQASPNWSTPCCAAENTRDYFLLMRGLIQRYGVPIALYTDRHSVFKNVPGPGRAGAPTQFSCDGRARHDRWSARQPSAKGRVERTAGTFQDRLVTELRCPVTIEEANALLKVADHFNSGCRRPAPMQSRAPRREDDDDVQPGAGLARGYGMAPRRLSGGYGSGGGARR